MAWPAAATSYAPARPVVADVSFLCRHALAGVIIDRSSVTLEEAVLDYERTWYEDRQPKELSLFQWGLRPFVLETPRAIALFLLRNVLLKSCWPAAPPVRFLAHEAVPIFVMGGSLGRESL